MGVPALSAYQQGQGVIPADGLNSFVQGGALLADLRAFPGLANMTVWVLGNTVANDGGAGMFYWDANSTRSDDGTTTIAPMGVAVGRWRRQIGGNVGIVVQPSGGDDTANLQTAVNDLAAAGGGILRLQDGADYSISNAVNIVASNIKIVGNGVTVTMTGTNTYSGFNFNGQNGTTTLTLSSNVGQNKAFAFVGALTAGCVAGNWLTMMKTAPDNGGAPGSYFFMARIGSILGTGGAFTLGLEAQTPIAFNTTDPGLALTAGPMISNVGIDGDIHLVCTGSGQISGVSVTSVVNSRFRGITGDDFTNGSVIGTFVGFGNCLEDILCRNSGTGFADIESFNQTAMIYSNLQSQFAGGFGPTFTGHSYTVGNNMTSQGARGRGCKFQANLFCHYTNTQSHNCPFTGIAVSVGSCYNTWHGASSHGHGEVGWWFSDQFNSHNKVYGLSAFGTFPQDVANGPTDAGNEFYGLDCGVVNNGNVTTAFYGLNGAAISSGAPTVATLLDVTSNGLALIPPLGNGSIAERWIGGDSAGDIVINAPPPFGIQLSVNGVTALAANSAQVVPGTNNGSNLGIPNFRWLTMYASTINLGTGQVIGFIGASPVAGTWPTGTVLFNVTPSVGQPKGWQCTTGGTPGTWVSMGNL
jgi:hypothetical protein